MSHDRYRRPSSSSHDAGIVYAPSRGGRPGGARRSDRVYGGVRPSPQGDAASVQRKPRPGADPQKAPIQMLGYNLARAGWQAAEAQSSWLDLTPERQRDPGDRGVYDAASMSSAATRPVQRKAVVDEMDAPKADSIREDRATIDPNRGHAAPATRGMGTLAAGGLRRQDVAGHTRGNEAGVVRDTDAPKANSIREERATIEPEADSEAAGPLSPKQAAHAVSRNRHTTAVYRVRPADVDTSAAPDTPAFAQAAARFQAAHGLVVDGIIGPKTVHALHRAGRHLDAQAASRGDGAASTVPADAGHNRQTDVLEDGVLGPDDVLEEGVLGPDDVLEDGVLGPDDVLEDGLIGQDDPLFAQGRNRRQPATRSDQLESGLIDEAVQRKAAGEPSATPLPSADVPAIAGAGVSGSGQPLPHLDRIQASFGDHHVTGVQAHIGGAAGDAAKQIGAVAYATGDHVAFDGAPDLHTAAHEAAHVVQQQHGVQLKGGVGQVDDAHEQHADAVADKVVRGESAEPLLDAHAAPAVATQDANLDGVQRKPAHTRQGSRREQGSAPTVVSESEAFEHIKEGQDAAEELRTAKAEAAGLYQVMILQAKSQAIHQQVLKDYDRAKKARAEALETSDLEKVLSAITTIVELGTSVAGVIKAAKGVYASAKGLHDAYRVYKATGGKFGAGIAKDIGKETAKVAAEGIGSGGKAVEQGTKLHETVKTALVGEPIDPETMLPDANHAAIVAGQDALKNLMRADIENQFEVVAGRYRKGALDFVQMIQGISLLTKQNNVLPPGSLAQFKELIDICSALQADIELQLGQLKDTWRAYQAGGAEALSDQRERSLFEKVQHWFATGDGKKDALHLAMDQSSKYVRFTGEMGVAHAGLGNVQYLCHVYHEDAGQLASGTLYINDPAVEKELVAAGLLARGLAAYDLLPKGPAESHADQQGGSKYWLSISMCKALAAIGVRAATTKATVFFLCPGKPSALAENQQEGQWFDNWKATPEFEAFWRGSLGAKYAYLQNGRGADAEPIPFASKQERDNSSTFVELSGGN